LCQDHCGLVDQRFCVRPGASHHHHEVVRVPDEPVVGQPVAASLAPLDAACLATGEVLVEDRQRHVGQ
jgi:hypothetical protein